MPKPFWTIKSAMLVVGMMAALSGAAADAPPAGAHLSLSAGVIEFDGPPSPPWLAAVHDPAATSMTFTTDTREEQMAIVLLPKDAAIDANAAAAIVKDRRAKREKEHAKVVMPAKVEPDSHFTIRIHEKYKVGEKTQDNLYLYRSVGPRVVELLVGSLSDDAEVVKTSQTAGEQVALSAKFIKAANK